MHQVQKVNRNYSSKTLWSTILVQVFKRFCCSYVPPHFTKRQCAVVCNSSSYIYPCILLVVMAVSGWMEGGDYQIATVQTDKIDNIPYSIVHKGDILYCLNGQSKYYFIGFLYILYKIQFLIPALLSINGATFEEIFKLTELLTT